MNQDFNKYLPADIITTILLRLPICSIIRCKYVCKSWLDLIESSEFRKVHLRDCKPVSGLAALDQTSMHYNFHTFEEYSYMLPMPQLSIAMEFTFPIDHEHVHIHSSVNGLFLFSDTRTHDNFVCNPLTRDYVMLPLSRTQNQESFGFGVSKMRGEYKIVRVSSHGFEVYTLGTGSWRKVAPCSYPDNTTATLVNGNLHWLRYDLNAGVVFISCFDLETELFTRFSPPRVPLVKGKISAFEDCLAFCYPDRFEGFAIWLMNEYGDDRSWTRKFVITYERCRMELYYPIKVLKKGQVLIAQNSSSTVLYYFHRDSNASEFSEEPCFTYSHDIRGWRPFSYAPNFLSLKTFSMENVCTF